MLTLAHPAPTGDRRPSEQEGPGLRLLGGASGWGGVTVQLSVASDGFHFVSVFPPSEAAAHGGEQ